MNNLISPEKLKLELLNEFKKRPIIGSFLFSIMSEARIVCLGPLTEDLFKESMVPFPYCRKSIQDFDFLRSLSSRDMCFVEAHGQTELWRLARATSAQIIHVSDKKFDSTLSDFTVTPGELKLMLAELKSLFRKYRSDFKSHWIRGSFSQRALFMDRDGVVNVDYGYLSSPEQIKLISGVADLIKKAVKAKFKIFFVTNQSGVARGYFSREMADRINADIRQQLAFEGAFVDEVVTAFYHDGSENLEGAIEPSRRKPRPGMLIELIEKYRIDVSSSIMIGDSARDLQAAALAGVRSLYLVSSGINQLENSPPTGKPSKFEAELQKWTDWSLLSQALDQSQFQTIDSFEEVKLS